MLNLEIISPEKVVFKGDVGMVVIPGSEGDFGVLPNHSPLVAQLREGELYVFADADGKKTLKIYSITGGFAQTEGVTCTILSDEVTVVDECNPAAVHGDAASRAAAEKAFLRG